MNGESQFEGACRHMISGEFEEAVDVLKSLLHAEGDHPSVRHNLALSLECCKKFEEAAKEYSTVIREFPEYAPAYVGMANCYFYEGDLEHCEGMLRAAKEKDPLHIHTTMYLSEILLLRGYENEGIELHRAALDLLDAAPNCISTNNHALCYGDFGHGAPQFYMWWESSLLQRDAFPSLPLMDASSSLAKKQPLVVFLAYGGNASDVSRRLSTLERASVYLVALDDVSQRILAEYTPDVVLPAFKFDPCELPALALHVGRHLTAQGLTIVLPGEEAGGDRIKLTWAQEQLEKGTNIAVNGQGDLFAAPPLPTDALHPRRIPPVLNKRLGRAAPDTFVKIFSS